MQAKASRALAAILLAAFLIPAVGCGGNAGVKSAQRALDSMQAIVDLLRPIQDAASAQAAIPNVEPAYTEFAAALKEISEYENEHGGVRGGITQIHTMEKDLNRLMQELDAESDRISELKGLPVEFWSVFRLESYKMLKTLLSIGGASGQLDPQMAAVLDQLGTMYEQHGPQRVLELTLTNVSEGDKDAAIAKLRELAGPQAQLVDFQDPKDFDGWAVALAPVDDFGALLAAVDFGTITDQEKARGEATIELNAALLAGDEGDAAPAETVIAQVLPTDAEVVTGPVDSGGRPLNPDGQIAADVAPPGYEDPGVPDGAEARNWGPPGYEGRGEVPVADSSIPPAGASPENALAAAKAGIGQLFNTLTGNTPPEPATLPDGSPNPAAPDYHAQLAELLFDAQAPHHELAVLALLEVKPNDVADKKVRARIAQGYKHVALETNAHAAEGVRGLVLWGGKFSAPLLISMLEQQAAGAEEAILAALGEIATPEAAEAVVGRIGDSTTGGGSDAAMASLREMGVTAEAALLAAMPFESSDANLAAINVLADVGTKKSVGLLRRASKSENEGVAEAALEAARKIQERLRSAKPGDG